MRNSRRWTCPDCGRMKSSGAVRCLQCSDQKRYIPTPEQIEAAKKEVQAEWNERRFEGDKSPVCPKVYQRSNGEFVACEE
jgi:tRNA(Ile2) C34 agmatinyltransferase TiaS